MLVSGGTCAAAESMTTMVNTAATTHLTGRNTGMRRTRAQAVPRRYS
jgi:hypothetical protein